jgi:hypothetical protein
MDELATIIGSIEGYSFDNQLVEIVLDQFSALHGYACWLQRN